MVMSYNTLPSLNYYWSKHTSMGNTTIKNATSRDRYKLLVSKLSFNIPEKPANCSKIHILCRGTSGELQTYISNRFTLSIYKWKYGQIQGQVEFEAVVAYGAHQTWNTVMGKKRLSHRLCIWSQCNRLGIQMLCSVLTDFLHLWHWCKHYHMLQ